MTEQNMKLPLSSTMLKEFMEAVMDYQDTNTQIFALQKRIRRYDLAFEAFYKQCEYYVPPLVDRYIRCRHPNTEINRICTIERCPYGKGK